jgi:hypothetical protein
MDREQVHETVNQLVESEHDQRRATTRLRDYQSTTAPPCSRSRHFRRLSAPTPATRAG